MTQRVVAISLALATFVCVTLWALFSHQLVAAGDDQLPPVPPFISGGSVALTVRIAQPNRAPILTVYIPLGAESVSEGGHLEYGLTTEDPDGTIPSLSAVGLPENSSLEDFGNGAGVLMFDPDFDQEGEYPVTVIASDGTLSDSVPLTLLVTGTNQAPVVTAAMELSTWEGAHLEFGVWASDPDGTIPALSEGQFPENAALIDSGNGSAMVTFDPDYDQAGEHTITVIASDGKLRDSTDILITVSETTLPRTFSLRQNYPNPFNDATVIQFTLGLSSAGTSRRVRLDVINVLGQRVRTIVDEDLGAGPHLYGWDSRDHSSQPVASGVYFLRLSARGRVDTKKMVLLR